MAEVDGPEVADGLARLAAIGDELREMDERRPLLYAERLALFLRLGDRGVTQADMGAAAGVKPGAVAFALHKARKKAEAQIRAEAEARLRGEVG